ncbi:MAG: RodZ domain-containing protein [Chloracidobacterium sp.]|uniref:DUF4115 domain-containing protein n=1 Tax=Chloracidobacterium validum TaxID=2821543 RepID=A0ABX8BF95_9BACT|nr:helix-turn-helix domain-containing protein [Chloracidobacterium validum]QUW03750.1 DUF4115 domain-containing protein [Chloracidobacterium validum]
MATLGQELKQQREARGKSLEEISRTTNIAVRLLHAIERDDYRELPGELYNRSFIRQLAQAVGYDEARALQLYERQSGSPHIPTDEEVSRAPEILPPPKTGNALLLTLSLAVVVVVAAGTSYAFPGWWQVFGGWFVSLKSAPSPQAPPAVEPTPPPTAPTEAPPPPMEGLTLELRATGKCWTRLQLDDSRPEEFVLLPDDVRLYRAKEKIVLSLGALQAVSVTVNGRALQLPSRDGITVKRAVITPDTLETGVVSGLTRASNLQ